MKNYRLLYTCILYSYNGMENSVLTMILSASLHVSVSVRYVVDIRRHDNH